MPTRDQIARIAVPAALTVLALIFVHGAVAAGHIAATAAPGDTETLGTFTIIGLMSAVCAAATGFLAWVSVDDARDLV